MRVTRTGHPCLHEALDIISHDMGASAGWDWFEVPPAWASYHLLTAERALALLPPAQLQEFAIGEEGDVRAMAAANPGLAVATRVLEAFWDEGWDRGTYSGVAPSRAGQVFLDTRERRDE